MFRIIFFIAILGIAYGATAISYLPPKPSELAHKEGCYIKEVDDVISFGKTITPVGNCIRISCSEKVIRYANCGIIRTDEPNCHITETDTTKPYPDCCPQNKCDIDNKLI
ncbi:U-megalopygitoxin(1)-Mo1 [Aphomia sociella]